MENKETIDNGWYYAANSERLGPKSSKEIVEKFSEGVISRSTLVWNKGWGSDQGWIPLKESDLIDEMLQDVPPIPDSNKGSEGIASFLKDKGIQLPEFEDGWRENLPWFFTGILLVGMLIEVILIYSIPGFTTTYWWVIALAYLLANISLATFDLKQLEKRGIKEKSLGFWFWLIPVYLWKRARRLGESKTYFWTWIAAAIVTTTITSMADSGGLDKVVYGGTPNCNSTEVTNLLTEMIDENLSSHGGYVSLISGTRETSSSSGERYCRAIVSIEGDSYWSGDDRIEYIITDYGDQFYVEIQ